MTLLGISGKRGSGKSLLAKYLSYYDFETVSLAGNLKFRCIADFGLSRDQVYGTDKETPTGYVRTDGTPLTSRDIMIRMGVFYRSIDPLYWCKQLDALLKEGHKYVIDDIRFVNEVKYFREKYSARFIRLERAQELNVYKGALDDLSETELDSMAHWDYKLDAEHNRNPEDLSFFAAQIERTL